MACRLLRDTDISVSVPTSDACLPPTAPHPPPFGAECPAAGRRDGATQAAWPQ
ncbi:hypothetical protein ACFPRL_08560 [Pseudoclavibacter helvolus]